MWISVKDRMPDNGDWVLTMSIETTDDFQYDIGYVNVDGTWRQLGWNYPVSHWMPLPEPPNP